MVVQFFLITTNKTLSHNFKVCSTAAVQAKCVYKSEEEKDRREGNGCRCCLGGWNSFNSMPHYGFSTHDDFKKRINRRTDAWQYGWFRKMNDHLVNTTPNHHPPKMDGLPKTFLQIILAAKWLVRYSSTSPKQQRRPSVCVSILYYGLIMVGPHTYQDLAASWAGCRYQSLSRGIQTWTLCRSPHPVITYWHSYNKTIFCSMF